MDYKIYTKKIMYFYICIYIRNVRGRDKKREGPGGGVNTFQKQLN